MGNNLFAINSIVIRIDLFEAIRYFNESHRLLQFGTASIVARYTETPAND
jgi:hypothetical protein